MRLLHWLCYLFHTRRNGYIFKFPIGLQKKQKRTALFGESRFKKGD